MIKVQHLPHESLPWDLLSGKFEPRIERHMTAGAGDIARVGSGWTQKMLAFVVGEVNDVTTVDHINMTCINHAVMGSCLPYCSFLAESGPRHLLVDTQEKRTNIAGLLSQSVYE